MIIILFTYTLLFLFPLCQSKLETAFFLLRFYLFLERGEGREKEEKHQCVVASHTLPTGDLAHNPDICLDWELNR